jgi:MFS family permease
MLESFNLRRDRSSSYLHCEGATSSIENAGVAYQAPSLLALGAGAREVALLSTLTNLFYAALLIKVPSFVKFGDSLKRATVFFGVLSVFGWLPLILVPILFKGISPFILIGLWVFNLVPNLMVGPLRDKWLSDIVPAGRLGRYLSVRSIISASTFLSFFYLMGYLLDHYKGGFFNGFSLIFSASLAVSAVSLVLYLITRMPVPLGESDHADLSLGGFVKEARQNNLGTFILFSTAMMFSTGISSAFFSVYMLRDLHFPYLTYTLVISMELLARIGISFFGGRWVDNAGAVKVLRFASFLIPFIPILWLFSHSLVYLLGIQIISGASWATFDLCTQSYLCKSSSTAKRLHYIVYHRSIVTLASALGPLVGSALLNVMFPVFGNPILGVFLLSGIMRLASVLLLLPRLKEAESDSPEVAAGVPGLVAQFARETSAEKFQLYRDVRDEVQLTEMKTDKPHERVKAGSFYRTEHWQKPRRRPEPAAKVARLKENWPLQSARSQSRPPTQSAS